MAPPSSFAMPFGHPRAKGKKFFSLNFPNSCDYAGANVLPRSPCSLNIEHLCDNFVHKLVSETRKCHQLQGDFVPLTPGPHWWLRPKPPLHNLVPYLKVWIRPCI